MNRYVVALLALPIAAPLLALACTSSDNAAPPAGVDAGSFDAASYDGSIVLPDGSGSSSGGGSGSGSGSGGGSGSSSGGAGDDGGTDAAPTPVDRFRHSWPITADDPDTSSYTVDADAGTVVDQVTGLIWTQDLLQQEQTSFDGGTGPGLVGDQSQSNARALCAGAFVGGFHDWRLPSMTELLTIVAFDSSNAFNSTAFLETGYGAEYWADTNTPDLYLVYDDHYHPWTFRGGSGDAPIRCVRSTYPVADGPQPVPAGRWTINAATAIDSVTKLEWQRGISGSSDMYATATAYCANLAASDAGVPAGGSAWRLPTIKEIASTWSEGDGGPEPTVFGPVTGTTYVWVSNKYWGTQSIPYANTQMRFFWDANGVKTFYWEAAADFAQTRCVRDAP